MAESVALALVWSALPLAVFTPVAVSTVSTRLTAHDPAACGDRGYARDLLRRVLLDSTGADRED
jgi:hypothetical protein